MKTVTRWMDFRKRLKLKLFEKKNRRKCFFFSFRIKRIIIFLQMQTQNLFVLKLSSVRAHQSQTWSTAGVDRKRKLRRQLEVFVYFQVKMKVWREKSLTATAVPALVGKKSFRITNNVTLSSSVAFRPSEQLAEVCSLWMVVPWVLEETKSGGAHAQQMCLRCVSRCNWH